MVTIITTLYCHMFFDVLCRLDFLSWSLSRRNRLVQTFLYVSTQRGMATIDRT